MSPHAKSVLVLFVRFLSAIHVGVAAYQVIPPFWKVPQLLPPLLIGLISYSAGKAFNHASSWRDVVLTCYVAPVGLFLAVHLLIYSPSSWVAGSALVEPFLTAVVTGPPVSIYLVSFSVACFSAERPKEPGLYR